MQSLMNQRAKLFWVISTMEGNRPVYEKNRIIFAIDCKPNPFFAYYWIEFILLKVGWELYFQSASQNKK